MARLFGGAPVAAIAKLLFVSLVVGAIMAGLGLDPRTLPAHALAALRAIIDMGFGAFRDIGRYILTGAVVVVPIWIVLRIFDRGR